jgi:hypothetical protein
MQMHNNHLNGWKEIGSYLGRVVRTAQRWEAQLGMPVHRPAKRKRTAVVAFPNELDTWLSRNLSKLELQESYRPTDPSNDIAALSEKLTRLQTEATLLALEIRRARGEVPQLLGNGATNLAPLGESVD